MNATVFVEFKFWLLIFCSVILPFGMYWVMLVKQSISPATILIFGFSLVAISGLDVYLLQGLSIVAKNTPSLADDVLFVSEVRLALYFLPAMFGGIGTNIVSHALLRHLDNAEKQFRKEQATHTKNEP